MDIASIIGSSASIGNYVDSKIAVNKEEKTDNNCDTVSLSSTNNDVVYKSDNYNNIITTVNKKKIDLQDINSEFVGMYIDVQNTRLDELNNYFSGKISIEDMQSYIKETYQNMKDFCIDKGYMEESDTETKNMLLGKVYDMYRYHAVERAMYINDLEGEEIAVSQYGANKDDNVDYAYYNADYYYACEEFRESLQDMFQELSKEENVEDFDTSCYDNKNDFIYDQDFNAVWNWNYGMNVRTGTILNTDQQPPEGMKIFYRELGFRGLEDNSSVLSVWYEGEQTEVKVPFEYNSSVRGECFNLLELLDKENSSLAKDSKLYNFLSTFFVHTRGIGALLGDNLVSQYLGE